MESKKPKRKRRTKAEMQAARAKENYQKKEPVKVLRAPKKGLGDTVEDIARITGVKAFVEFLNGGEPCEGCEKRKAWLNKVSKRRPKAMTLEEFKFIESIKDKTVLKASENVELTKAHARIFNYKYSPPGNCGSCAIQRRNDLVSLYEAYLKEL